MGFDQESNTVQIAYQLRSDQIAGIGLDTVLDAMEVSSAFLSIN